MSFVSNYPLIFLPESIKTNLAEQPKQSLSRPKLKKQLEFTPTQPVRHKQLPIKKFVTLFKYIGWLFSSIVGISVLNDVLQGETLSQVLPGIMLLIVKSLLVTAAVQWANKLERAQQEDLRQQQQRYWQENQRNNQDYHVRVSDQLRQKFEEANPHLKLNRSLKRSPLYNHSFERGIEQEAQKGVSEKHFLKFLNRYFADCEITCDYFALNESIGYTTDFSLITPDGRLGIDLEIDEPYEGKSKKPHHCQDNNKDRNRDRYFLERGWVVVRLSEYQVVRTPESCCKLIAALLDKLGYDVYLPHLLCFEDLFLDSSWTSTSAQSMVARKYREIYLDKAGLFKYNAPREKRNVQKYARNSKKSNKRRSLHSKHKLKYRK